MIETQHHSFEKPNKVCAKSFVLAIYIYLGSFVYFFIKINLVD